MRLEKIPWGWIRKDLEVCSEAPAKCFEYCHHIKREFLHQTYPIFKFPIIVLNPQVGEVLHSAQIWLNFSEESFTKCCLLCARHQRWLSGPRGE